MTAYDSGYEKGKAILTHSEEDAGAPPDFQVTRMDDAHRFVTDISSFGDREDLVNRINTSSQTQRLQSHASTAYNMLLESPPDSFPNNDLDRRAQIRVPHYSQLARKNITGSVDVFFGHPSNACAVDLLSTVIEPDLTALFGDLSQSGMTGDLLSELRRHWDSLSEE